MFSHAIGFDDAPFAREHRGDVAVFGTVYARHTLHGVVGGRVRRDGRNSAAELARLVGESGAREHLHLILLQGVALAGFNVVDVPTLGRLTGLTVLVVATSEPGAHPGGAAHAGARRGTEVAVDRSAGADGALPGGVGAADGPEPAGS